MDKEKNITRVELPFKAYWLIMTFLTISFVFLLTWKLTDIPVFYNVDEAGTAYDAKSLANYHVDRFLYHFPVYLLNYDRGQSVLYAYLTAGLIKLFGFYRVSVRLPAVFLSLLSAIIFSLFLRKRYGSIPSVISMGIFCILPFSVMHSRWGLDAYLFFPMLMISCVVLCHAVDNSKCFWYFLSSCLFGMTLYSYALSYVVVFVFLVIIFAYLLFTKKISLTKLFIIAIVLFILALPLILLLLVNFNIIGEIKTRFLSVPKLPAFGGGEISFLNIIDNLRLTKQNIFYKIFVDDGLLFNIIPEYGSMYFISVPLIFYGMMITIKKVIHIIHGRSFSFDLIMAVLFFVIFLFSLMLDDPNVNRVNGIYVPLFFFLIIGFSNIFDRSKILAGVYAIIYLVCFISFLNYYFHSFSDDLKPYILFTSIEDFGNALSFAEEVSEEDYVIYILDHPAAYLYVLLLRDIDPYTFDKIKVLSYDNYIKMIGKYRFRLDAIMPDHVYIYLSEKLIPKNIDDYGFERRNFGSLTVFYPQRIQ